VWYVWVLVARKKAVEIQPTEHQDTKRRIEIMSEKYYLTRRNIDKQENILWKKSDEKWAGYIYICGIDSADEFSLEQIEEMQRENIDDFVFDYAYRKEDILKLGKKLINRKDIINLENFRIVKPNKPKRKPLSDGTLPLTNGEMSELCEIMGYQNICKIFYDNKLHFKCFDKGWGIITDVKAILWLAERFDLNEVKL